LLAFTDAVQRPFHGAHRIHEVLNGALDFARGAAHGGGARADVFELVEQREEIARDGDDLAAGEARDVRAGTEGQNVAHRRWLSLKRPWMRQGVPEPIRRKREAWWIFRGCRASEAAEPIYGWRAPLTGSPRP